MSSQKSETLHFDGLLLFKSYEVSSKKLQKSYLSWHWRVIQSLKKNWLWFRIWHEEFGEFLPNHSKVRKFHSNGHFLFPVYKVWAKKFRHVIFHDTEQWYKILINPDLVVSKIAWGIWWTLLRALKQLKYCTLMGSFCAKYMFQLENFRGIMCHDTRAVSSNFLGTLFFEMVIFP